LADRGFEFLSEQKLQQSQRYADAAMGLLERHSVPPLPDFYRLFYDYLAGAQLMTARRVEAALQQGGEAPVRERLYEEFVRPYEAGEATERAASLVNERIEILTYLIDDAAVSSRKHPATLEAATTTLAASSTRAALLKDWIVRLEGANRRMLEVNQRLVADLDATAASLEAVCAELAQHRRDSLVDPLTGLVNRLGFDTKLSEALIDARDNGRGFALAIIDIDNFKDLNDSYGHLAGDAVLRFAGRALLAAARNGDVIGRFGGDEFVAIIRDADDREAEAAAERLCRSMRGVDLQKCIGGDILGNITCSIGITCFGDGDGVSAMLGRADQFMYEAKRNGRNRWVSAMADELRVRTA
jgi:diguanylate cyclase